MPEQDAVLAITAGVTNMQGVLNCVWQHLLPGFGPAPLMEDKAAVTALEEKLSALALPAPQGQSTMDIAARAHGKVYHFGENEQRMHSLAFSVEDDEMVLTVRDDWGTHRVVCGDGEWRSQNTTFLQHRVWQHMPPRATWRMLARGAWTEPNILAMRLCFNETPFAPTITCPFDDNRVVYQLRGSVGFGPSDYPYGCRCRLRYELPQAWPPSVRTGRHHGACWAAHQTHPRERL